MNVHTPHLLNFQKNGVKYLTDNQRVLLADEVGLGKSLQSLVAVDQLQAYPALVVCPAGLKLNWKRECNKWLDKEVCVVNSKSKHQPKADIYIINYDIIYKYVESARSQMKSIIVDESQRCGNYKSRWTRSINRIAEAVDVKFLLSGTPVMNKPRELAPQLNILDVMKFFGGNLQFLKRYCDYHYNGFAYVADGSKNLDELRHRLEIIKCFLRRTKQEVLPEFPVSRTMRVDVDVTNDDIAFAEKKLAEEFNSLTHTDQFAHTMKLYQTLGVAKLAPAYEWISSFLTDTNKKLVVFAHHQSVQKSLANHFGASALTITSETPMEQRHLNVSEFANNDQKQVMICSLKAAGAGIDGLQHATDTVLFVEQGWNPPTHEQAIGRLHRMGQRNCVDAYFLVIPDTFDEDIWDLVQEKKQSIDRITGDMVRKLQMRRV